MAWEPRALQLLELLDFLPDEGIIRLHDQRMIIQGATAMGLLRKALIDALDVETARRLLLRFGYADGYHDAVSLREHIAWPDPLGGLRAGFRLHTLEGIVLATPDDLRYDASTRAFSARLRWRHSYEAEQHVQHLGPASIPVCWTLVGYISGFASACFGHDVFFLETACAGQGRATCELEGRDAERWGEHRASFETDFRGSGLRAEVERLRAAAREQRREISRRRQTVAHLQRELDVLRERAERHAASHRFVARSAAMRDVLELAARVAPLDTSVLVQGESGTGKEFIVRMIHDQSPRASGPLVSVNCATLTEPLLESELFGHVRGSFTGAVVDKAGLFEVAGRGTLFLDEIGEMAPAIQAKLLRALQSGEIRRVGGQRTIRVRPRIVAATNRDLRAAATAGTFREDLYFRIGAFVIRVPPLRDRRDDIPPLVHEFVRRSAARLNKSVRAVSADAMRSLVAYPWPGNVRELEHAIERAVILADGSKVAARDLPPEVGAGPVVPLPPDLQPLQAHERDVIRTALEQTRGHRRRAARALGISPVTLWRKMKRYGLSAE